MRRKAPYTAIGIQRLKCYRCGARKPTQQWQICADGNVWRPVCNDCDVALNDMVLRFMGVENAEAKINDYRRRVYTNPRACAACPDIGA